jgi:hypothetical protein
VPGAALSGGTVTSVVSGLAGAMVLVPEPPRGAVSVGVVVSGAMCTGAPMREAGAVGSAAAGNAGAWAQSELLVPTPIKIAAAASMAGEKIARLVVLPFEAPSKWFVIKMFTIDSFCTPDCPDDGCRPLLLIVNP